MARLLAAIFTLLFVSACSSGIWDAAFTGMCIASEASCVKSCQNGYKRSGDSGNADGIGYDYCAASCTNGGNGCAFTAN